MIWIDLSCHIHTFSYLSLWLKGGNKDVIRWYPDTGQSFLQTAKMTKLGMEALSSFDPSDFNHIIRQRANGRFEFRSVGQEYLGLSSTEHFADAVTWMNCCMSFCHFFVDFCGLWAHFLFIYILFNFCILHYYYIVIHCIYIVFTMYLHVSYYYHNIIILLISILYLLFGMYFTMGWVFHVRYLYGLHCYPCGV